ncbi:MAG: hypothetical protein ACLUUF_00025 [Bifidobacterium pullorum]
MLSKPLAHIKSAYVLVPITFLLGNLLSLVVPSASNLAIILLATLYPAHASGVGMSTLSAARRGGHHRHDHPGLPLGSGQRGDRGRAGQHRGLLPWHHHAQREHASRYHALVSIPTPLPTVQIIHYSRQRSWADKRGGARHGRTHGARSSWPRSGEIGRRHPVPCSVMRSRRRCFRSSCCSWSSPSPI